jgi:hypothetical protein
MPWALTKRRKRRRRKKLVKCYILSTAMYGAGTGEFGKEIRNTWKV